MTPWKIALGVTAIPLALAVIWIPQIASTVSPLLAEIVRSHPYEAAFQGSVAFLTTYWLVWNFARRALLTDVGDRVRMMDRDLRAGRSADPDMAEKLAAAEAPDAR